MSGLLFIGALVIILPIVVIGFIIRQIQYLNEGNAVYAGPILQTRAKFLSDVFGLQIDELKRLHFDGYSFHFTNKAYYKDFTSVRCISIQDVVVVNPALPHTTTWRYTRVNGGPDRRYSNNPATMTSRRFILQFNSTSGQSPTLTTYGFPRLSEVEGTIEKFNTLFNIAAVIDLEPRFNKYKAALNKLGEAQTLLDKAIARRAELDSVLAASKRLLAKGIVADNLIGKQNEIVTELDYLNTEIPFLQRDIISATNEMTSIVQNIHLEISQYEDLKAVRAHRASHSNGHTSSSRQREQEEHPPKESQSLKVLIPS